MNGGLTRQYLTGRILLVALLAMLAGCSTWFAPPPAPQPEQPAPEPAPVEEAPPAPASEAAASAPIAAAPPREAPEPRHVAPKPTYRRPSKPRPAPAPTQMAPTAPPPLITTRTLAVNDTHALLDARVQRPDGHVIGRAIDMFVDAAGKPRELLVNLAGFMGIGDRKMRFPWTDFKFDAAQKKAIRIMRGQGGGDILVEIGALLQFDRAIAIGQPIGPRTDGARHFLQAIDVGIDLDQVIDERGVQHAAPDVQRQDFHALLPWRGSALLRQVAHAVTVV